MLRSQKVYVPAESAAVEPSFQLPSPYVPGGKFTLVFVPIVAGFAGLQLNDGNAGGLAMIGVANAVGPECGATSDAPTK